MCFLQGEYLRARCKRIKIQDSRDNEPEPSTSKLQTSSHLKKSQEHFRNALVNIILWVYWSLKNVLSPVDRWTSFFSHLEKKCEDYKSKENMYENELYYWLQNLNLSRLFTNLVACFSVLLVSQCCVFFVKFCQTHLFCAAYL